MFGSSPTVQRYRFCEFEFSSIKTPIRHYGKISHENVFFQFSEGKFRYFSNGGNIIFLQFSTGLSETLKTYIQVGFSLTQKFVYLWISCSDQWRQINLLQMKSNFYSMEISEWLIESYTLFFFLTPEVFFYYGFEQIYVCIEQNKSKKHYSINQVLLKRTLVAELFTEHSR